jgi:hypothetical protein
MAVPATYPIDEELIKLCMVNQLFRLGLAEHFVQEAEEVLAQVYRYIYLSFAEEIIQFSVHIFILCWTNFQELLESRIMGKTKQFSWSTAI